MVAPVIRFCGISSPGSHEELPEKAEIQLSPHRDYCAGGVRGVRNRLQCGFVSRVGDKPGWYGNPKSGEIDVPLNSADYCFLEALGRFERLIK